MDKTNSSHSSYIIKNWSIHTHFHRTIYIGRTCLEFPYWFSLLNSSIQLINMWLGKKKKSIYMNDYFDCLRGFERYNHILAMYGCKKKTPTTRRPNLTWKYGFKRKKKSILSSFYLNLWMLDCIEVFGFFNTKNRPTQLILVFIWVGCHNFRTLWVFVVNISNLV